MNYVGGGQLLAPEVRPSDFGAGDRRRLAAVSDQAAIDERIQELVDARRPQLEALVDEMIAAELARLVEERLTGNGNGAEDHLGAAVSPSDAPQRSDPAETKTCTGCGKTLEAAAFEPRRLVCRRCRRDQVRAREQRRANGQPDDQELPRPDSNPADEDPSPHA